MPTKKKGLKWVQKLPSATVRCPNCAHTLWIFIEYDVSNVRAYKTLEASLTKRTTPESEKDTPKDTSTDTTPEKK
jgi:hypothetical protein